MSNLENSGESAVQGRSAGGTASEAASAPMWRWLGYALLLLSLFDTLESAIPIKLMNPEWELQFMGSFIERSPVPLLGFVFIFFAEHLRRTRWSRSVAQGISWAVLVVGLGCILTVPLIIANTFRMETRTAAEVKAQLDQQLTRAREIEDALASASGDALSDMLNRLGRSVEGKLPEENRQEVLDEMSRARQALQARADEALASQRLILVKRSYKWAGQAVAVGGLLVYMWWATAWIRRSRR